MCGNKLGIHNSSGIHFYSSYVVFIFMTGNVLQLISSIIKLSFENLIYKVMEM